MASPKGSRRLLGGGVLLAGATLAFASLLALAQQVTGDAVEPLSVWMIASALTGVLLGLVLMGVGAMLGR